LVEHTTENRGVAGSIPALAIYRRRSLSNRRRSLVFARIRFDSGPRHLPSTFFIEPATIARLRSHQVRFRPSPSTVDVLYRTGDDRSSSLASGSIPALAIETGCGATTGCVLGRLACSRKLRSLRPCQSGVLAFNDEGYALAISPVRPPSRGGAASSPAAGSGTCIRSGCAAGSPGARARPPRRGRPR
jgi:hypothetical protein